jgi:hypothetical protein
LPAPSQPPSGMDARMVSPSAMNCATASAPSGLRSFKAFTAAVGAKPPAARPRFLLRGSTGRGRACWPDACLWEGCGALYKPLLPSRAIRGHGAHMVPNRWRSRAFETSLGAGQPSTKTNHRDYADLQPFKHCGLRHIKHMLLLLQPLHPGSTTGRPWPLLPPGSHLFLGQVPQSSAALHPLTLPHPVLLRQQGRDPARPRE